MSGPPLLFRLEDALAAAELVHRAMPPTPQYAWPMLARRLGSEIWVKHENHTPTGAFKVRGGLTFMSELKRTQPAIQKVLTATRGNHGQSIAFAASRLSIQSRIFVPVGNSREKNAAMRAFGAEVIEVGRDFDDARQECLRAAGEQGHLLIPAFHRQLVLGVGTYALELFNAVPDLDVVYVPIGMGSGVCGVITMRDVLGLRTEVVGVTAKLAPATALSFAAGRPIAASEASTFADGLATRNPDAEAISIIHRGAARIVEVDEGEISGAMRALFHDTHQVAEGAGAAPLAAALKERNQIQGKKIGIILSGANIDTEPFHTVLQGGTPSVPVSTATAGALA